MAVKAVQNNTNNNQNKMSYSGATVVGSICGYSARWLLPITKSEKNDKAYTDELKQLKHKKSLAWREEIEEIRKEAPKSLEADEFIKLYDKNKKLHAEIKKFETPKQEKLMNLLQRANSKAIEVGEIERDKLNTYTKKIRSAGAFVIIGAFIGLGIALMHNVHKEASKK